MTNLASSNTFLTATTVSEKENEKIKFDRSEGKEEEKGFFPVSISVSLERF